MQANMGLQLGHSAEALHLLALLKVGDMPKSTQSTSLIEFMGI